jgi:hypothetical protein
MSNVLMRFLIQGEAMPDNSEPLDSDVIQKDSESDLQDGKSDSQENCRQDMFAETFDRLMNGFGKACEKEGVEVAVAIVKHPQHDQPFVFYKGNHIVDAASLMAEILRQIKEQIFADLDTDSH